MSYTREVLIKAIGLLIFVLVGGHLLAADNYGVRQPNIVLIIGDDISVDDFGCYGHPNIRTPNIDALAADGLRFTNAYLTCSQCSPTRCSVITGRYPHNTGAPELHMPLSEGQVMFPQLLREAGYYTVQAGKWHLGNYAKGAFDQVFERKAAGPGGERRWVKCLQERPKNKPFFAWFASTDAHRGWDSRDKKRKPHELSDAVITPFMVGQPRSRKDLTQYYDEVQRLDRYVGLVVEELKRQGILDTTLIMFMADNGRPFPRCKCWLYDSGVKTPLIVRWPAGISDCPAVSDALVSVIDIAPTILGLAGVETSETCQGVSLVPLLKNSKTVVRQYIFAEQNWHDLPIHERMVRCGNYVYLRNNLSSLPRWTVWHYDTPSYKDLLALKAKGKLAPEQRAIFAVPRSPEELYDVKNDPEQLNNMVASEDHQQVLKRLRTAMDNWMNQTGDTIPKRLTPARMDGNTLKKNPEYKGMAIPFRGDIPGQQRGATEINNPGPR